LTNSECKSIIFILTGSQIEERSRIALNYKTKGARVYLDCLGCKLNKAEIELMTRQFVEAGYKVVADVSEADVYILNTCTVTHIADRKSRHLLRMAHRRNPNALLVATGCYAQRAPEELAQIKGVSLVLGNTEKLGLIQKLGDFDCSGNLISINGNPSSDNSSVFRTRSCIKVQDGCNSFCSYCIVPLVRGREESVPVERVVTEVRQRVIDGYKEVVLTGTEIGSYSCNNTKLADLLECILIETDVNRLRLSSLQPQEISAELIALWRDERLCRHFHLPLQSGSNEVLSRMRRRYSVGDYQKSVDLIRETIPEAAITTDIIVGFPGETEAEFEQSYNFCQQIGFARIHVFPYSARQGTLAAQMTNQVEDRVKKERSQRMLKLAEASSKEFYRQFLGKTMTVLFEQQSDAIWSGLTDNYIKVYARSSEDLTNKLIPVRMMKARRDGVWGEY